MAFSQSPDRWRVEDLEGDGSTQLGILSPVDGGKAARADGLQDVVASDPLSCYSGYLLPVLDILVAIHQPDIRGFDMLSPL